MRENGLADMLAREHHELTVHQGADPALLDEMASGPADLVATPFQSPAFLSGFYENLPESCSPLMVSVRLQSSGQLAMVLPLILRQSGAFRSIEAADLGMADYVAPALADGFQPCATQMQTIWNDLRTALPQADVLTLKKMPGSLPDGRSNPLAALSRTRPMGIATKIVDLGAGGDRPAYRKSGIYKDGMRQLRKLGEIGQVEFRIAATPDEGLRQFDELMLQRRARFEAMGRPDDLAVDHIQKFYRTLVAQGVADGQVLFGGLYVDGECIATDLGLVQGDTHHGIFTTMRSEPFARFSPGTIAFMLILDETVRRGIRYYDIGVGEFPYKARLKGDEQPLYERHEALSLRGQVALADAGMRRAVRHGLARYPALRAPVDAIRRKLYRAKLWVAASLGLVDWQMVASVA